MRACIKFMRACINMREDVTPKKREQELLIVLNARKQLAEAEFPIPAVSSPAVGDFPTPRLGDTAINLSFSSRSKILPAAPDVAQAGDQGPALLA
jgi:hypothetical protein